MFWITLIKLAILFYRFYYHLYTFIVKMTYILSQFGFKTIMTLMIVPKDISVSDCYVKSGIVSAVQSYNIKLLCIRSFLRHYPLLVGSSSEVIGLEETSFSFFL